MFSDLPMRIFALHFTAFIAGVLICAGLDLWLTPDRLWFPWVLMGWGVAIAVHAFALLLRKTRRRERIFIDPKARAAIVHLFAYLAVMALLFFVNLTVRATGEAPRKAQIRLAMSPEVTAETFAYAADACGWEE